MFQVSLKNPSGGVLLLRQHSKKNLVKANPPQSWPWKQIEAAAVILEVVNNFEL